MTILVCHEMGHFVQAWRNGVYASFPYFIPVPFPPLGTMGAVIAMEARMGHRRALFDIGISGPLAGLIPTIIFCTWGIKMSTVEPMVKHLNEAQIWRAASFSNSYRMAGETHSGRICIEFTSDCICGLGGASDYEFEFDTHRTA